MNVAELRKALEGLPDEMPICHYDEDGYFSPRNDEAQQHLMVKAGPRDIGHFVKREPQAGDIVETVFVIGYWK